MNRFHFFATTMLALLCGSAFLRAEGPDDEYVRIYSLIQQADALAESGRSELARQKYSEAHSELDRVQRTNPGWNQQVVQFRLDYVREKLGLAKTTEKTTRRESAEQIAPAGAESVDRIKNLLEEIRRLVADKELLQAKLKEALSAQPVALDPRELARAEENIKALRKEVEVLTVNLKKAETKPDKPIDPAAFEKTKQGLAAANQKLTQQTEVLASLTLERDALQRRLQSLADGTDFKALRGENESLKGQLNELQIKADELKHRLSGMQADSPAPQARKGNLDSQRTMPEDRTPGPASRRSIEFAAKTRTLERELADARKAAQTNADLISVLQSALRRAQEEKDALTEEKKQAKSPPAEAQAAPPSAQRNEIESLTHQNVLIQVNLAAAQIGQNRLAEGEATLKRALASNPNNAASLTLLGVVKVRQHKYDEALDLLSQSAQLDPQNANTFQYLGVTLVEKGLRQPAESAFRRAIQLAPENSEAHHRLAIVYATQQPPALELARLHYQKGLAGGHPKDAKLEQMLSANKSATVGGVNASNR